jgi:hypothetical protein
MQTINSKTESKRTRRRGSLAAEILADMRKAGVKCSLYEAKRILKFLRISADLIVYYPEIAEDVRALGYFIRDGVLKYKDALPLLEALREAPELIPLVASGEYPLDKCLQELKEAKEEAGDELSFEEKVEQSFERFLSKWPKDKRQEIWSVIEDTFEAFYEE